MKFLFSLLLISASVFAMVLSGSSSAASHVAADKITVDELISKHLDSIGPAKARATAGSRLVAGTIHATFRSRGTSQADGGAVLASDGPRSMITMKFESSQYPYEKVGFDGAKVTAFQLHPGEYSRLGGFIRGAPEILKEGLLGGVLSSSWPFLGYPDKKLRVEVGGTKKINNRPAYEVKYIIRGGSDLTVTLAFDAETFQHIRTVYKKEMPAQTGRGGAGAGMGVGGVDQVGRISEGTTNSTFELTEEFSDFKPEGDLTIPHTYKIKFEQLGSGTQMSEWVLTLVRFAFRPHLEVTDFDVSS
jgi:hypothetical protein